MDIDAETGTEGDMDKGGVVQSAVIVRNEDWDEFCRAREVIRGLLKKNLDPMWGFVHTKEEPRLEWEGAEIVRFRDSHDARQWNE